MKLAKGVASELQHLQAFYADCGYGGSVNEQDDVYYA